MQTSRRRFKAWLSLWVWIVLLSTMLWLKYATTSRRPIEIEQNSTSAWHWIRESEWNITLMLGRERKWIGRKIALIRGLGPRRVGRRTARVLRRELTKIKWKHESGWYRSAVLFA